ncbi:MAG: biotin--[acetyl-CoA-carboxylase] ligase [Ruminococcus sp.]|nr:biotin--[acetyl-CoA-carboxylase] ligase [Ruminococcus sp.]
MNINKIEKILAEKAPVKLHFYDEVESTNDIAKAAVKSGKLLGSGDMSVFISVKQTKGKGRNGKTFVSPKGGLYMSFVIESLTCESALYITAAASVAVVDAVELLTAKPCKIKWVNDVILNGFKICGILAEKIDDIIVLGIGINVSTAAEDFPSELKKIVNSVENITGKKIDINQFAAEIILNINNEVKKLNNKEYDFIKKYRSKSNLIGKEINIIKGKNIRTASALDIDDDCSLVVEYTDDKSKENLRYGEVSIKY